MHRVTLARNAMATRFEIVLVGGDPIQLRAAGEEALDEIDRIEGQLSVYKPSSEIAQVNRRAGAEAVRVSPAVFQLLKACRSLCEVTRGCFDISVGPLVRCWGFMKGTGERPGDDEISRARENAGSDLWELDEECSTVRFGRPGAMLDLGSVGKGYALDAAADILRESGVTSGLLNGGTSTILGIGDDPEHGPWKVAIELPAQEPEGTARVLSVVELRDRALSVSAVWGKSFVIDGQTYGHVIDPRTGWPARNAVLGAAVADSAAVSDALSTGVLLGGEEELQVLRDRVPGMGYLQMSKHNTGELVERVSGLIKTSWSNPSA